MLIGYARVSTHVQEAAAQVAALEKEGCEEVYTEVASGGRWDRPELHRMLDRCRKGDTIVVVRLDRLSRSLADLLRILERFGKAKVAFRSLNEALDTTTPAGRAMFQIVGVFAEFERGILRERTMAGLEAARQEGRLGGRPRRLTTTQEREILKIVRRGKSQAYAARVFNVSTATVCRLVRRAS